VSSEEQEKSAELDKLPWRAGKTSGVFIFEEDCPQWLLDILKSTQKSYSFAGFDFNLSTPAPSEQYPEPRSFVWKYYKRD